MLTPFGKFCRKLRIDNGELLKHMAEKLGVTPSYLSAIENGKRNVPRTWTNIIINLYSLDEKQQKQLYEAINESQINNKINLKGLNSENKNLVMALARRIEGMNDEEKAILRNLFNKK